MVTDSGDFVDSAAMRFVDEALTSLGAGLAAADTELLQRWFVPAFNDWYCPAVRRGYRGTMTPVFDLGMLLCEPVAMARLMSKSDLHKARQEYVSLLEQIGQSPLTACAHRILRSIASQQRLSHTVWLLLESLLRALDGVWTGPASRSFIQLPRLVLAEAEQMVMVHKTLADQPIGQLPLRLDTTRETRITYPALAPGVKVNHLPGRVRLFAAYVALRSPNALDRLDYEVIEACLRGPNLRAAQHDPPPVRRTESVRHSRSVISGAEGGVTRAEVKLPEDPPINILPSELAPIKGASGTTGLLMLADILLNRKPLVYKRENPRGLVPRHKTLVCFLTGVGAEGPAESVDPLVHPYRHTYVYAKRQVFDMVRDLREALHHMSAAPSVHMDVAVLGLRRSQGDMVAYGAFPLDEMPVRGDSDPLNDRQTQLETFHNLVHGFFERLPAEGRFDVGQSVGAPPRLTTSPHVAAFLRQRVKATDPYQVVHLVLIGSLGDLPAFISMVGRHSGFDFGSRQCVTLIGVDLGIPDAKTQIRIKGEPMWLYKLAGNASEVGSILARNQLPRTGLDVLRRQFVDSVLGRMKDRGGGVQNRMRLAQTGE